MGLIPIKISAFTDENFKTPMPGLEYKAMLNPDSITWQRSVEYNKKQAPNSSSPSQKYKNTPSDKLNFDIVIDCTGIVDSTRTNMSKEIDALEKAVFTYNGKIHRPNFVKVQWGEGLDFKGVLEAFNTTYSLFRPDGSPLRAKVSLNFSLYISPKTVKKLDKCTSPDITHVVTVQEGMTLPQLCQNVWNKDTHYVQVAKFNDLNKFPEPPWYPGTYFSTANQTGIMGTSTQTGDVITYDVKVGGNIIPDEFRVLSVHIDKGVNRIPTAKIVILDGEAETGEFAASSSGTFVPGLQVSIEAGYNSDNQVVFQGIITGQSIRIDDDTGSVLEIECRDMAVKMIVGRKCLTYSQQKDSDIITAIIGTYSGLTAAVTETSTKWPEQVQYYVTDWDYILERAEMNGLIVTALNGTVSVFKPDANTTPAFTATYGCNLIGFSADLNAVTQLAGVKASSWDYTNQNVTSAEVSNSYTGPGNLTATKLSTVVGLTDYQVQTTVPLQNADLTNWSQAQLVKSEYAKIRGEVSFQGTNAVDPGKYITLKGLGDRFNGDHLISGVVHDLSDGNWITEVSLGLSPVWFIEEPDVLAPPASGLLPGARGLFNGTVKQMYQDPDSQYRILVNVSMFDPNGAGIWARLANFYSTSGAGAFFLPEVGDEVVLGFLNEDPRYPVILGSMYSSSNIKPFQGLDPNQTNSLKAIVSKSGITIQFDDANKILTIITPAKNQVILDDQHNQITIQDDNQNSIIMSGSGIAINSANDISITADKNVSISGAQGVTVQSSAGDVATSGINISEAAESEYSAAGNTTAKINSGMELTLKSAMIMIN